ncbi:MAG: GTP cyclohydrolase II [Gammaproteobacteria bacterium]|nr:GTP cyclohydrolase II [Pseudomonadales bacterium]MCP5348645.1 GTP cyclohydrolase II [Pseudomonadales bacterium]
MQSSIKYVASARLPTQWGVFTIHGFEDTATGKEHVALAMGDTGNGEPLLTRIHSECLTGDCLFSQRCDCGPQLQYAIESVAAEGRGLILYLRQEGRGIGLLNKIKAYELQDSGADTVEANEQLGFKADSREYQICLPMLEHFKVRSVRLLTNNPRKVEAMGEMGIKVAERLPIHVGLNSHNESYLAVKVDKLGHLEK